MKSKHRGRSIRISERETSKPGAFVRAEVEFRDGGANYLSGTSEARGYYLSVYLVTKEADGTAMVSAGAGHGILVQEAGRYSDDKLKLLSARAWPKQEIMENIVLARHSLRFVNPPTGLNLFAGAGVGSTAAGALRAIGRNVPLDANLVQYSPTPIPVHQ